jgi:hypothetical protein
MAGMSLRKANGGKQGYVFLFLNFPFPHLPFSIFFLSSLGKGRKTAKAAKTKPTLLRTVPVGALAAL